MPVDAGLLQTASLIGYLLVFLGGLLTSIGPCNLAMIPLVIGFVGGSRELSRRHAFVLSLSFVFGLAVTFMLLGVGAALLGGLIGGPMNLWYYLVAFVCFVIGLQMLGALKLPMPMWFGGLQQQIGWRGVPGALALGLVSGLVASQCATPVLAVILTYVMAQKAALVYGATLLLVYALGRGVPVVLAGTFVGSIAHLNRFRRWSSKIEAASGVVMLMVGFYFLWTA